MPNIDSFVASFMRYAGKIGTRLMAGVSGIGKVVVLLLETLKVAASGLPPAKEVLRQLYFVGVESLPVVLTTGAFVGMVMAYSTYFEFKRLGVDSWVGPLVAKGMTQQLGPVLVGVMLAGRVGCAMTAEIAYMTISEQVDALKTMGVSPLRHLVLPRLIAFLGMSPLLTGFSMMIGISSGLVLAITGLGAEPSFIWNKTVDWMYPYDFFQGMCKVAVFGVTTAMICCYKGLTASGGAEGVGRATTEANVASCITVLVTNLFLTMVLGVWSPTA